MNVIDEKTRRYAAVLGRRHFEGSVTLSALFEHFGSSEDPLIRALLEAAANQPRRGFFGISEKQWQRDFLRPVSTLLDELEKGVEGRAPMTRVYPPSGFAGILGFSALTLFAGSHVQGRGHLADRKFLIEEHYGAEPLDKLPGARGTGPFQASLKVLASGVAEAYPELHESPPPERNTCHDCPGWQGSRSSFYLSNPFTPRLFF